MSSYKTIPMPKCTGYIYPNAITSPRNLGVSHPINYSDAISATAGHCSLWDGEEGMRGLTLQPP